MLHGTCGELPGGARLGGAPAARPGMSCTRCTSLGQRWWVPGQGKAVQREMKRRMKRMLGAGGPYLEPPWAARWAEACSGGLSSPAFPASLALGRDRGPAEGTLGKRDADAPVLPLKPVWFPGSRAPEGSAGAPAHPCGVRAAVAFPWELAWRHCRCSTGLTHSRAIPALRG